MTRRVRLKDGTDRGIHLPFNVVLDGSGLGLLGAICQASSQPDSAAKAGKDVSAFISGIFLSQPNAGRISREVVSC